MGAARKGRLTAWWVLKDRRRGEGAFSDEKRGVQAQWIEQFILKEEGVCGERMEGCKRGGIARRRAHVFWMVSGGQRVGCNQSSGS